jgi:hypothetical protein
MNLNWIDHRLWRCGWRDVASRLATSCRGSVTAPRLGLSWGLLLLSPLCAWAGDEVLASWAEGASEFDGATRDYYNRAAHLAWEHQGGDWRDARGTAQGQRAFATAKVKRGDRGYVDFNVTDLVREWVDGEAPNHGFLLRCTDGIVDFATREADSEAPQLVISARRQPQTLTATADTGLSPSTYKGQGLKPKARCDGSGERMLVRFDLSQVTAVDRAELRLATVGQYANLTSVEVFAAHPGAGVRAPSPRPGLAARYPGDEGLSGHPDVVFVERFERAAWADTGWSSSGRDGVYRRVESEYAAHGYSALDGAALEVTVEEGSHYGLNLSYFLEEQTGEEPEELYLRYYMRFGTDWAPRQASGKLPGIAGTYIGAPHAGGWGGRTSNGRNGWSARGLFTAVVPQGNPLAGRTPIGTYLYHANQRGTYGDSEVWNQTWDASARGGIVPVGKWFSYEVHVKLNTPGQADGLVEGWIDGVAAYRREGVRFRAEDAAHLRIERVWMNIYHGGSEVAEFDQHVYLDNVVVARNYVGPMVPATPMAGGGTVR